MDTQRTFAGPDDHDRATAETAITTFAEKYGAKYEKAVTCLLNPRYSH